MQPMKATPDVQQQQPPADKILVRREVTVDGRKIYVTKPFDTAAYKTMESKAKKEQMDIAASKMIYLLKVFDRKFHPKSISLFGNRVKIEYKGLFGFNRTKWITLESTDEMKKREQEESLEKSKHPFRAFISAAKHTIKQFFTKPDENVLKKQAELDLDKLNDGSIPEEPFQPSDKKTEEKPVGEQEVNPPVEPVIVPVDDQGTVKPEVKPIPVPHTTQPIEDEPKPFPIDVPKPPVAPASTTPEEAPKEEDAPAKQPEVNAGKDTPVAQEAFAPPPPPPPLPTEADLERAQKEKKEQKPEQVKKPPLQRQGVKLDESGKAAVGGRREGIEENDTAGDQEMHELTHALGREEQEANAAYNLEREKAKQEHAAGAGNLIQDLQTDNPLARLRKPSSPKPATPPPEAETKPESDAERLIRVAREKEEAERKIKRESSTSQDWS